jgi:SAM-dependent methyltransferase
MSLLFDETKPTPLCEIMGRNKSDKGSLNITESHHNYTTFYYSIFRDIADKELRIFELGLGTNDINIKSNMGINGRPGASLYGWEEFFKNSQIFGADIDKKILFNTERIHTFYCDQTNPEVIKNMWDSEELLQDKFDIIIEDGLHEVNANVCFFENSIHKLKSGGYYIIEDILTNRKDIYENIIKKWEVKYPNCLFKFLNIPSYVNINDNNLVVVYKKSDA